MKLHVQNLQGNDREQARDIALGAYPNLLVSEKSDFESDTWELFWVEDRSPRTIEEETRTLLACLRQNWPVECIRPGCYLVNVDWAKNEKRTSGPQTTIDPRLSGEFLLTNWPGLTFRIHPQMDWLICHDWEVVTHVLRNGEWLDFVRCQQYEVLEQFYQIIGKKG